MILLTSFLAVIFSTHFLILLINRIKNLNDYKTDLLLFQPKWIKNKNLGFRRILSFFLKLHLIVCLLTLFVFTMIYTKDLLFSLTYISEPYYRIIQKEALSGIAITFSSLLVGFWFIWLLLSIGNWVVVGFKKQN